jgi:hypothetical protein
MCSCHCRWLYVIISIFTEPASCMGSLADSLEIYSREPMIGTKLGRYPGLSIACLIHCTHFGWWRYNCVLPRSRSSSVAASEYDSETFWFIQAIDTWCELLVLWCISSAARPARASARSFPVLPLWPLIQLIESLCPWLRKR